MMIVVLVVAPPPPPAAIIGRMGLTSPFIKFLNIKKMVSMHNMHNMQDTYLHVTNQHQQTEGLLYHIIYFWLYYTY